MTFHVALGAERAVHPNRTLKHREYLGMIDMMFASARLFHPGAKSVVITDRETRFGWRRHWRDSIRRYDIDPAQLMLERANAQMEYVRRSSFRRPIVALDSDILVNGSLQPIFERDFDVALTWRWSRKQPINGGLLILNNRRPEASKAFFERYVGIYKAKYSQQAAWYGDQLALRDAVGMKFDDYAGRDLVETKGCRILLLPCDTYNFSPDNGYGEIARERTDKLILHFKGERKRLMLPYWRAWLHPRADASAKVQERAARERAWLAQHADQVVAPAAEEAEEA